MKGYSKYLLVTIYICIISVMVLCVLLVKSKMNTEINVKAKLKKGQEKIGTKLCHLGADKDFFYSIPKKKS